jgi:hypothetical protein
MSIKQRTNTSPEQVKEMTEVDILSRDCLEEATNLGSQEQFPLSPEIQTVKDFYKQDMPDRTLVPALILDKYRMKAISHGQFDIIDPTHLNPELQELLLEEFKAHPTLNTFPWLPYSHTTDAYLLKLQDLKRVFTADDDFYYDDEERKD